MVIRLLIAASATVLLAGCGSEEANDATAAQTPPAAEAAAEEPVRDVQYFVDNPDELEQLYSECRNNPGELGDTPECINVLDAHAEVVRRAMREELGR